MVRAVHIQRQELASLVYGLRQLCGWRKCDLGGKMRSESRVVGRRVIHVGHGDSRNDSGLSKMGRNVLSTEGIQPDLGFKESLWHLC